MHTFLQEVECFVDKKTLGRQLVSEVTDIIGVKPALFFSLQYDTKDGRRKFLSLNKCVLDHKLDKRHKPLQMYLRLRIYPPREVPLNVGNTRLVVYRELKQAISTGELICPAEVVANLNRLAEEERIEDYLHEIAEKLENYGVTQFNMKREDGYPILFRTTISGIKITAGNEKLEIPFSKMKNVDRKNKALIINQLAPAPDVKVIGPDSNFVKEVQEIIMIYYAVHKQLNAAHLN